ncbi:Baculovirus F protein [Popillia japonica]|uniref:Baculovirus F protein n=1 Tax=Popillia japonica TaxID=7064 RepID=A0AAW1JKF1_POPJA
MKKVGIVKKYKRRESLKKIKKRKLTIPQESDTDDFSDIPVDSDLSEYDVDDISKNFDNSVNSAVVGDYVLVKFSTKRTRLHYVRRVEGISKKENDTINFLGKKSNSCTYYYPEEADRSDMDFCDLVLRLSPPNNVSGTSGTQILLYDKQSRSKLKKLAPNYLGPFKIIRIFDNNTAELQLAKNKTQTYHFDLLKPYVVSDGENNQGHPTPPLSSLTNSPQPGPQVAKYHKVKTIDASSGLLYQNLGKAKVMNQNCHLISYYNLTHIGHQIRLLDQYYLKSLDVCNLAISEHYVYDCRNQLRYINTKSQAIKQIFRIISHQMNFNINRKRRGLFKGVGDGLKWLFGVPDADDGEFYSDSIESLINGQTRVDTIMQQQGSIIQQTITNFNTSLIRMNENIFVLSKNLKNFQTFANEIKKSKHQIDLELQLSNHLLILIEMSDELLHILQTYENDVLIQNGIISYHIPSPEQLFSELQKLQTKYTYLSLCQLITLYTFYLYYKIIQMKSFIKNNMLIIGFDIPLVNMYTYDLYQMFPLPTPHQNDPAIFSYIEPTYQFILVSIAETYYHMINDLTSCKEYIPKNWVCYGLTTSKKIDFEESEIQLLLKTTTTIPRSCQTRNLIAGMEIWHPLQENSWLFATSRPVQISIICLHEETEQAIVEHIRIFQLTRQCKAFTKYVTLEAVSILSTSNLTNEIPDTQIEEDDCCINLKENLTLNSEPIKFTNLDLQELKFAQSKLKEFDEQLQNHLNKPFIIKRSSWYTTALTIIALLILLYNLLRWCGCLYLLKKLCCFTSESRSAMVRLSLPVEETLLLHSCDGAAVFTC